MYGQDWQVLIPENLAADILVDPDLAPYFAPVEPAPVEPRKGVPAVQPDAEHGERPVGDHDLSAVTTEEDLRWIMDEHIDLIADGAVPQVIPSQKAQLEAFVEKEKAVFRDEPNVHRAFAALLSPDGKHAGQTWSDYKGRLSPELQDRLGKYEKRLISVEDFGLKRPVDNLDRLESLATTGKTFKGDWVGLKLNQEQLWSVDEDFRLSLYSKRHDADVNALDRPQRGRADTVRRGQR